MKVVTVKLIERLINDMVLVSEITNITTNFNGTWCIESCELFHVRPGSIITIDNVEYEVERVDYDKKKICFNSASPVTGTTFTAPPFFFMHGTPVDTGNVLATIMDSTQKIPLIYLLEVIRDEFNNSNTSVIERQSNVNLFFLDEANYNDWDVDQHYSDAIIPMFNLCNYFVDYLRNSSEIGVINDYNITYHAKFGLQIRDSFGHINNLFTDNLSGVQLTINIAFKRSFACC
jgi:hypothetical protein